MRETIEATVAGSQLFGTWHRPDGADRSTFDVGVVLLSPGHVARAGAGDLFPQLGDELARRGFPVFRFDFPGLGDSFGTLPEWEFEYFRFVQTGGNRDFTQLLIDHVKSRFGVRDVVLGGLCGGAITTVFAADESSDGISGMLLMDPDFSMVAGRSPSGATPDAKPEKPPGRCGRLCQKLVRPQTWMRFATGENRLRHVLRPVRSLLMALARRLLGKRLPSDMNFELVAAFKRVVERRVPALVLTAAGMLRELYFEQVANVALARTDTRDLERVSIPGTNHVFTAGGARATAIREVSDWVARRFGDPRLRDEVREPDRTGTV